MASEEEFKVPTIPSEESKENDKDSSRAKEGEDFAKLKAKYPQLQKKGAGSALLQKRLNKGTKYFDSGDYNMAKSMQGKKKAMLPAGLLQESTGDTIPTPDNVPVRKTSISTHSHLSAQGAFS